jgi:hypothetical protein
VVQKRRPVSTLPSGIIYTVCCRIGQLSASLSRVRMGWPFAAKGGDSYSKRLREGERPAGDIIGCEWLPFAPLRTSGQLPSRPRKRHQQSRLQLLQATDTATGHQTSAKAVGALTKQASPASDRDGPDPAKSLQPGSVNCSELRRAIGEGRWLMRPFSPALNTEFYPANTNLWNSRSFVEALSPFLPVLYTM